MRLLPIALAAALTSSAFAAARDDRPHLHNSAMTFVEFWDANKDKPAAEQVTAFKAQVAPVYPGFYSAERRKSDYTPAQYDGLIESAVKEFPAIRTDYIRKAQQFQLELPRYTASFKAAFPDFQPPEDIYILHSLAEMDGGMRWIDGKGVLIFGVDGMVKYHGTGKEAAFFHHELFHTYHHPQMAGCGDATIWSNLWTEGLAVYVSKVLNPDANEREMLVDLPDHMAERTRAVLPAAWAQLDTVLDNNDYRTYVILFNMRGDADKLPKRRGYYLGYLVAQEAARTHSIQELAGLQCEQARQLVHATVHRLRTSAQ
jgi:hypothetical protein